MAPTSMDTKNAPAILTCKRCKNKVVNGVKCIECSSNYHVSCAKLLNNVTFMNDSTISCCDSALTSENDNAFFDAVETLVGPEKKVDMAIFKYIIKQKDLIINELRDQVETLNKYINTLKTTFDQQKVETIEAKKSTTDNVAKGIKEQTNIKNVNTNKDQVTRKQQKNTSHNTVCSNKPNHIEIEQVASAIKEVETQLKCKEYINIEENHQDTKNDGEWRNVTKRRQNRRGPLVIGDSTESNSVTLKGVPKMISFHVYRVEPNTSCETLTQFLKPNFPEVICENINSRHPELYSSFKVTISEDNFKKAMDPSKWPKKACISRFLDLQRRRDKDIN